MPQSTMLDKFSMIANKWSVLSTSRAGMHGAMYSLGDGDLEWIETNLAVNLGYSLALQLHGKAIPNTALVDSPA